MNNNKETNLSNGIKIVNAINFTVPKSKKAINIIPLIIVAFFGIYGTVFSFFSTFNTTVDISAIRYYTILFIGIFTALFMTPKKFHLIIIPVLCVYGFLLYYKWREFIIGFKMLFNQVYSCIYPDARRFFKIKSYKTDNMELFLVFAIFLLAALICYEVYVHSDFLLSFLLTFPILEIGFYFGKSPRIIYAFMVIIFWITMLALSCCGYYQKFSKKNIGFIRKNNAFIAKPGIKFQTAGISVSIMAAICCIIFLITAVLSVVTDYKRPDSINSLRSDLKLAASEFSFDNFGESMEGFSAALGIGKTKLYSHKLGNVGSINFKNTTEITVETDKQFEENIYLKGYIGSVYDGDEWETLPKETYDKNRTLFDNFQRTRIFPQNMLENYFSNSGPSSSLFSATMHITSEYKNEKYNYTPYLSVPTRKIDYIDDTLIEFEDKNDYSFKVNMQQISLDNFVDVNPQTADAVNGSFNDYSDFVYQNYLSVPDTKEMQEVYDKFISDHPAESGYDYTKRTLSNIKSFLSENAEYSLSPGRTPGTEDFVNYFLLKNHKGFCVHFATSGILLARMMGIPARYAEGYVLRSDDFSDDNLKSSGIYSVDIKDNRAHAWAEVYIDGLGWIPVEFTPPSAAALSDEPKTTKTSQTTVKTTKTTASKTKSVSHISHSSSKSTIAKTTAQSSQTTLAVKPEKPLSLKAKITILVIAAFIIMLAVIAIRHFLAVKKRNDILNNGTPKNKITLAYESAVKLIEFSGIERNNMQYLEFADYVKEQLPEIFTDNAFKDITEIMLKVQMSNIKPEEHEISAAVSFYKKLYAKIYKKSGIIQKITIKYLKNL